MVRYKAKAEQADEVYALKSHVLLSHWSNDGAGVYLVVGQVSLHSIISAPTKATP